MSDNNNENGPGSSTHQTLSDSERVQEVPTDSEGHSTLNDKQQNNVTEVQKLNGETTSQENEDVQTNDAFNLDAEEQYNREVLGAEPQTSLDDLLISNGACLDNTESGIVHKPADPVEINIVKAENVNGVYRFTERDESISSEVTDISRAESVAKDGVIKGGPIEGHASQESIVKESQNCLEMPETREETEGCMSPSLMFSVCRYRWEKTIVTQSDSVVFVTLNNKEIEPVKLVWTDNSKCFYSDEFKIPTGKYVGNLVVDGVFYPVEDITVKHYTFEVDLYLKDDIIEDEVDKTGINKAEQFLQQQQNGNNLDNPTYTGVRASTDNYSDSRATMEEVQKQEENLDSSIHVSSKYEDLVRSQMSQSKSALSDNLETETNLLDNLLDSADLSGLDGRRSPVGDDGGKQYQDGDAVKQELDMGHVYHMNGGDSTLRKEYVASSLVQDDVEKSGRSSNASGTFPQAAQEVIDDIFGSGHSRPPIYSTETPVYSRNGSAHSFLRQTPVVAESQNFAKEPVRLDSLERRLLDNLIDDSVGRGRSPTQLYSGSRSGSERGTPQPEQIADVLNPADRHSPIRREYLVGSPRTSEHGSQRDSEHGSVQGSAHSSQRQTPQKDIISDSLRASHEKLYSGQDFRRSSDRLNGSLSGGNNQGSRPQSLTSEQELTQYYELTTSGGSPGLPPVTTGNGGQGQRTSSASSLPVVGSQRQSVERRIMTPDNHIRVPVTGPIIKSSLLPNRGLQRTTPGSNTSSRTVTPVNTVTEAQDTSRLQEKIVDLENTVSNVRVLLASREKEVFELKGHLQEVKDVNKLMQEELDQRRARVSPGLQIAELERQYREVVDERETLSAEVFRLKEEIRRKEEERTSLNSYDPNGPNALQRKIDDLSSQIQDLQEANESAVEEIKAGEDKIKQLAGDNETLRATQASNMRDLEDENRHLKHEIARLKEYSSHTEVSDYRIKIELQQVKEDNRALRERNYQLHDDNIKLKEELDALRKSLESVESNRKSYSDDRHGARNIESYKSHEPKLKSLDGSYHSDHGDRDYKTADYLIEKRDVDREKEREKHTYSYTSPSYESKHKYELKHERVRGEKSYEDEKYTSLETSSRYDSYRSVPDGGSAEKSASRSLYEPRPLTPERPSALGPPKRDYYSSPKSLERNKGDRLVAEDSIRTKRERSRTSSAELDFRSVPLTTYSDLSKTMPALSGRSRAIYKSLSDLRSRSRSKSPGNRPSSLPSNRPIQFRESSANSHDNRKYSKTSSLSSKIFIDHHLPRYKNTNKIEDETSLRIAPDLSSSAYTRGTPPTGTTRKQLVETYSREDKGLDHRPAAHYQDDGDVSDTATDILVNAQPLENLPSATWNRTRPRRGSVGSDGSDLSFGDIDDQLTSAARKRSKSADGREVLRRMTPSGILSRSGPTTPVAGDRTASSAAGFRSVTPTPLTTQHNKTLRLSPSTVSLTQGLRPFAPRNAGDLQVSDVIKFSRQGGKLSQGTIKFIGHLPGRGDIYLGVELDKEDGKHDGTFEGIRYFKCKPSKGVFVAYNKVVMAWTA